MLQTNDRKTTIRRQTPNPQSQRANQTAAFRIPLFLLINGFENIFEGNPQSGTRKQSKGTQINSRKLLKNMPMPSTNKRKNMIWKLVLNLTNYRDFFILTMSKFRNYYSISLFRFEEQFSSSENCGKTNHRAEPRKHKRTPKSQERANRPRGTKLEIPAEAPGDWEVEGGFAGWTYQPPKSVLSVGCLYRLSLKDQLFGAI